MRGLPDGGASEARISFGTMLALAILAVPRAVLHDLEWVDPGSPLNLVLAVGPPLVWIVVVLRRGVAEPWRALVAVGAIYGVLLAVTHQLLWSRAWDGDPPTLGGRLQGALPDAVEDVVVRGFAVFSSIATGLLVGAVSGLLATVFQRTKRRAQSRRQAAGHRDGETNRAES